MDEDQKCLRNPGPRNLGEIWDQDQEKLVISNWTGPGPKKFRNLGLSRTGRSADLGLWIPAVDVAHDLESVLLVDCVTVQYHIQLVHSLTVYNIQYK